MSGNYIAAVAQDYFACIDKANDTLEKFSNTVFGREDKVFALLEKFVTSTENGIKRKDSEEQEGDIDKALQDCLQAFSQSMKDWGKCIKENKKGQKFIHENEKHMLIMIFGAVNTGKSSLGNFFAGKPFLPLSYENEFRKRHNSANGRPVFAVEKEGRRDNLDEGWFREGAIDTTGAIQHFTVPGLRWVDSPGTGSLGKEGDTCSMEEMVQEYISYADLGVFLITSDSPGLQPDFQYISKLQENGKPAIILITKSDINDEGIENGEIVNNWVAKSIENRAAQERWVCGELQKMGVSDRYRVVSVSTFLATQGLKKQNDDMFKQSQLDLLMQILGKEIGEHAIELKTKNPREYFNRLIREIAVGVKTDGKQNGFLGILDYIEKFNGLLGEIAKIQNKMLAVESRTVQRIKSIVEPAVQVKLLALSRRVEGNGKSASEQEINNIVEEELTTAAQNELNKAVTEIISEFDVARLKLAVAIKMDTGLAVEHDQITQRFYRARRVRRDPEGGWEKLRSWFGKEYYRTETEEETRTVKVEIGTNIQLVLDKIMLLVDNEANKMVHDELDRLSTEYFKPQEDYLRNMIENLNKFKKDIQALTFTA